MTYYRNSQHQQAHNLARRTAYILVIRGKTVVDTSRQDDQIILAQPNPNPFVLLAANIKVTLSIPDIANLLVFVQMLTEERLYFLLVDVAQGLWRNADFIAVLVSTLRGYGIYGFDGRTVMVDDTNGFEVGFGNGTAIVVGFTLVTLFSIVSLHIIGIFCMAIATGCGADLPAGYRTSMPSWWIQLIDWQKFDNEGDEKMLFKPEENV